MTTRALLTDRERDVLAGKAGSDAYRATVRTRVRNRLGELEDDVAVLATHEPELYEQFQAVARGE
ncbi:hypothetical protein SAMN05216226_110128 [Halovenus aranensis]|jgi:hypothetical protein|uniref:Uncharacterized protein n=1 Tax=Halovenus aranensis TaxID=890420 RepID=A0A1G8X650_9EURY|nr:hypothetical protein [Halovenus aranensis]SDJ86023.1 hypothetical protein SAMN05216226_110128 [Halovenus aranensis]